jgi:NAD(P)-dependent dehydrogenase (short-subunit alcohol dehydrogenase family)
VSEDRVGALAGRVALVTGGASGIGAAIAELFAAEGASTAIADLDADAARVAALALRGRGLAAEAFPVDVSAIETFDAVLDAVESEFGVVDILVNNAGIGPHADFLDVSAEQWDAVHAVNSRGPFFLMQQVARRLVQHRMSGSIINVTSVVVERVWLANTAYAAHKAALAKASEYAAAELGPFGIRVNVLAPGPTDTPLSSTRYRDADTRAALIDAIPLRRIGRPGDLAHAALFLAGDHSSFITGQTLHVDGGRRVG